MGLVALQHVGSSQTRDRTCVLCIGGWILIHCTTREVPDFAWFFFFFLIFIGASLLYNGVLFSAPQQSESAFEFIIRKSEVYGIQKETDDLLSPCVSNSPNMCLAPSGLQVLDYILGI